MFRVVPFNRYLRLPTNSSSYMILIAALYKSMGWTINADVRVQLRLISSLDYPNTKIAITRMFNHNILASKFKPSRVYYNTLSWRNFVNRALSKNTIAYCTFANDVRGILAFTPRRIVYLDDMKYKTNDIQDWDVIEYCFIEPLQKGIETEHWTIIDEINLSNHNITIESTSMICDLDSDIDECPARLYVELLKKKGMKPDIYSLPLDQIDIGREKSPIYSYSNVNDTNDDTEYKLRGDKIRPETNASDTTNTTGPNVSNLDINYIKTNLKNVLESDEQINEITELIVDAKWEECLAKIIDYHGGVSLIDNKLTDFIKNCSLYINAPRNILSTIWSTDMIDDTGNKIVHSSNEKQKFNIDYSNNETVPIYCSIAPKNFPIKEKYTSVVLEINDNVKQRTTMTLGDSSQDYCKVINPMSRLNSDDLIDVLLDHTVKDPITNIELLINFLNSIKKGSYKKQTIDINMEGQIFGNLSADSIKTVYVPKNNKKLALLIGSLSHDTVAIKEY